MKKISTNMKKDIKSLKLSIKTGVFLFKRIKILFKQKNRQFIQAILIIFLVYDYNTDIV
jgi:hypothetical protein